MKAEDIIVEPHRVICKHNGVKIPFTSFGYTKDECEQIIVNYPFDYLGKLEIQSLKEAAN